MTPFCKQSTEKWRQENALEHGLHGRDTLAFSVLIGNNVKNKVDKQPTEKENVCRKSQYKNTDSYGRCFSFLACQPG